MDAKEGNVSRETFLAVAAIHESPSAGNDSLS